MSVKRSMVTMAVLIAGCGVGWAQTEWVEDPVDPVLVTGGPGSWDYLRLPAEVVLVDDTYHLFFGGQPAGANGIFDGLQLGHATSSDGVAWEMDPANPVLTLGEAGEWDSATLLPGAIVHDGDGFHLWYHGKRPDGDTYLSGVGYATSPDGSTWEKHDGNPIMGEGLPGTFDDGGVLPRTVIVRDGLFQMWYTAIHRSDNEFDWRIGYAVSSDGLNWTRHPVPVMAPGVGWEQLMVFAPHVRFERSQYHMWYSGSSGGTFHIGYAVSSDGIEWTRYWDNPVVSRDPSIAAELPLIVLNPNTQTYEMWYRNLVNYSIYRAVSNCCTTVHLLIIPAAAVASGAHGAFYQTDLDLSNADDIAVEYELWWLPRGEDNSDAMTSETFNLGAGMSVRYANVLNEVFDLEPDELGALMVMSTSPDLLAMSRTYNLPGDGTAGSYGQAMAGMKPSDMVHVGERRRILFGTEHADMRTNIGCQNGTTGRLFINLEMFDMEGTSLGTEMLMLQPLGNEQLNRIFEDYAPVTGYVEVWTILPTGAFYCYGSVLDNTTSDPTTIPPQ